MNFATYFKIAAAILYVAAIAMIAIQVLRAAKDRRSKLQLSLLGLVALFALFVSGFFPNGSIFTLLFLLLGVILASVTFVLHTRFGDRSGR